MDLSSKQNFLSQSLAQGFKPKVASYGLAGRNMAGYESNLNLGDDVLKSCNSPLQQSSKADDTEVLQASTSDQE